MLRVEPEHRLSSPFAFLERPSGAAALVDAAAGRVWTQDELAEAVKRVAERMLSDRRELVFCLCRSDVASIVGYLAAVQSGHAAALLPAAVDSDLTTALIDRYQPGYVVQSDDGPIPRVRPLSAPSQPRPAPELAVLLSTSGTTGSPKLVRLSRRNLDANADAIAGYLDLDQGERALQSLPIHYSYGLSVLNSHLSAGASVLLTPHSIMRPEFWADAERWGATSFAGVPQSYTVLARTGLLRSAMPDTMSTLTVAGGRLAPGAIIRLHGLMSQRGGHVWVMYGQTEATARISYVPPEALPDMAHTIGIPIPGGQLSVCSDHGEMAGTDEEGELVYRGANVMLGYAECPQDLALGDQLGGELRTGDLGACDANGFFRVTGRRKRIAKVYGLRISLDEVEAAAAAAGPVAAVDGDERIVLWREARGQAAGDELRRAVARRFRLHSNALVVRDIEELPLRPSGKVDYDALASLSAR